MPTEGGAIMWKRAVGVLGLYALLYGGFIALMVYGIHTQRKIGRACENIARIVEILEEAP